MAALWAGILSRRVTEMNEKVEEGRTVPAPDSHPAEITKEELKARIRDHAIWLDSGGREGRAADFKGARLKGAVLIGARLKEADFEHAYLYGAYLKRADLEGANLKGANLRGANLRWANLKHADLQGANLVRADLQHARLENTNLHGANLKMTEGLVREQIGQARCDETTVVPDYLNSPD
ncbi:MAG: pentapeptide repeat-containing protein [Nitrospinaceae bacterium]